MIDDFRESRANWYRETRDVTREVGFWIDKRKSGQRLSEEEELRYQMLEKQKHQQIIEGLKLRQQDSLFRAGIIGREGDRLHSHSYNELILRYGQHRVPYDIMANMRHLRGVYDGDLVGLIGIPNIWLPENPNQYIGRTMAEIRDIRKAMIVIDQPTSSEEIELGVLVFDLAKRIFVAVSERNIYTNFRAFDVEEPPQQKHKFISLVELQFEQGISKTGCGIPIIDEGINRQMHDLMAQLPPTN